MARSIVMGNLVEVLTMSTEQMISRRTVCFVENRFLCHSMSVIWLVPNFLVLGKEKWKLSRMIVQAKHLQAQHTGHN